MTKIAFTPPVVTADNDGIQPDGPPDACLYCKRRVGLPHAFDCVSVCVPRVYRVVLDNVDVGTWTTEDPVSWTADSRWFHKNESSWCANNVLDHGTLRLHDGARLPATGETDCLCNHVELRPVENEPEYEFVHGVMDVA